MCLAPYLYLLCKRAVVEIIEQETKYLLVAIIYNEFLALMLEQAVCARDK